MAVRRKRNQSIVELRDELVCPVCLDLYTVPVILPCSHVLCRACADRLFDHLFLRCPVCRERSYLSGGMESLPRVRTIENIITRYRGQAQDNEDSDDDGGEAVDMDTDILCQLCTKSGPRKAYRSCQDCNASYCAKCLELSHPDRAPFSDHTLTEPTEHPRPKVSAACF